MFDFGFWELALIAVVALLVVGPERLPSLARTVGLYISRARRMVTQVRDDIEREVRADELKKSAEEWKKSMEGNDVVREAYDSLDETRKDIERAAHSSLETVRSEIDSSSDTSADSSPDLPSEPGDKSSGAHVASDSLNDASGHAEAEASDASAGNGSGALEDKAHGPAAAHDDTFELDANGQQSVSGDDKAAGSDDRRH